MYLFEELTLLAINPYTGKMQISPGVQAFRVCIAGAILRDLELLHRIQILKNKITILSLEPINNVLLGNVLFYIKQVGQFKSLEHNLSWIANYLPDIENYITDLLVQQGILHWSTQGCDRVTIINRVDWYRLNWYIKAWIERRFPLDMYGLALLGVTRWCGVLKQHLNPRYLTTYRIYIDHLIREDDMAKIIHKLIRQEKPVSVIVL
jgi:hypothetical protein